MNHFKIEFKNFLSQNKYLTEKEYDDFISQYKGSLNDKHYSQLNTEKNKYLKVHNNIYLNRTLKDKKEYFDNMFKTSDPNLIHHGYVLMVLV